MKIIFDVDDNKECAKMALTVGYVVREIGFDTYYRSINGVSANNPKQEGDYLITISNKSNNRVNINIEGQK